MTHFVPIHIRRPRLEAHLAIERIRFHAARIAGQRDAIQAHLAGYLKQFIDQCFANALTARGLIDDDIFNVGVHTAGGAENALSRRADD